MKLLAVALVLLVGCGESDGPSCKQAVELAAKTMYGTSANADRTAAMVGTCVMDEWSVDMRLCVAGATVETDLVTCFGKHKQKSPRGPFARPRDPRSKQDVVGVLDRFSRDMCQCKDKACADRVMEAMTKWATEMAKTARPDDRPEPDMIKKVEPIMTRYTECLTKLMMPPTPLELGSLVPAVGDTEGGTYVVIKGSGFTTEVRSAKVYFGSRQGTVVRFASDTELIVQAPGGKPGEIVDVLAVFEPGGQTKLDQAFTFVEKAP